MGDRVILHSDINSCYASIELLHHPELRGKPLAVGGDPEARHGIVLTADYVAKKHGVNMALAQLQEFELKTDGGNCPDNLEREIESLKKSKAHYAKLKFEIYDDYTKANITRDQMAKKTAEVKQKIAEIESLITQKQETLDMQKDLFLDAKQEQLTKLSKLDEFDEEVIRYLIDYVLVYDNEHIEIRWNFDDFQAG